MAKSALIVGTGSGISASTARALHREGYRLALAARRTDKLTGLVGETGAAAIAADATKPDEVKRLFDEYQIDTITEASISSVEAGKGQSAKPSDRRPRRTASSPGGGPRTRTRLRASGRTCCRT